MRATGTTSQAASSYISLGRVYVWAYARSFIAGRIKRVARSRLLLRIRALNVCGTLVTALSSADKPRYVYFC